ncbi:MAG: tail fiber domain-containing protein, partial [bacterium]
IRDNNGVMEYKDVGGSWTAITGGGGATSGLSLDGGGNLIANTVSSNIASSNSPYQSILLGQGAGDGINASSPYNILIGSHAGFHAYAIQQVIFLGSGAGDGATHAANSIFIGTNAGYGDTVDNTSSSGFSILLGPSTSTGGYSNSIAIGKSATNSATNQFMVGSNQYPIRQFVLVETGGQNAYINFINGNSSYGSSGYETGDLGYGFKDDNGTMKYKNEGGSWTAFGGGSTTPTLDGNNSFVVGGGSDPLFSNFIGIGAGQGATGAQASNFFGTSAGNNAYAANNSNFFGANAGRDAIFASSSNFFGSSAGNSATNAHDSNFLGNSAGYGATSAQNSNFFGQYAGYQATNAGFSIFLGPWAGYNAVSAYNSIFLGQSAGQSDNVNNTSNNGFSILLGPSTSTGGYSNSIAIGGTATNTKSNQLMLGSSSYPISDLSINNVNYTFPSSQGSSGQTLVNDGSGNLTWQTVGGVSLDTVDAFIVGGGADMVDSVFIGKNTGAGATSAHHSNFFGAGTGYGATNASGSNFLGNGAGYSAISASGSNFIGQNSGFYANNANDSIFLGNYAGSSATNAAFSTFIGGNAGQNATNAADAIFIGNAAGEGDTINTSYSGSYGHSAILIGNGTSTGGYIDSIAIGQGATNTKTNQLMLGSSGYPISALSINNVNYTFPASQGLLGQTLVNDGNGNLSWSTVGGGTGITSINGNTATAQTIAAGTGISISNNGNGTTTITNTSSSLLQFDGTNNSFYSATTPDTQGAVFLGYRAGFSPQSEYNSVAIGTQAGYYASLNSTIVGYQAGMNARYAELLNAFGMNAGYNAANARNSIFIGANAGYNDSVDNTSGGYSILIGTSTNTGGYSNSIAIGSNAINTATNQFMIGSSSYPINSTVIKGSGSTQCTITTGTGIACSSDITLKKNITAIPDGMLAKVLSLNPVTYNWKTQLDTDPTYAGFIAQQVEVIFPQAVSTDPSTGTKLLSPTVLIPFTIKAIQEMDIQMQGLASLKGDSGNTFKDALIAWFADVHNGINKLFVREIDTTKICVSDTTGATCITKGQLDKLLAR